MSAPLFSLVDPPPPGFAFRASLSRAELRGVPFALFANDLASARAVVAAPADGAVSGIVVTPADAFAWESLGATFFHLGVPDALRPHLAGLVPGYLHLVRRLRDESDQREAQRLSSAREKEDKRRLATDFESARRTLVAEIADRKAAEHQLSTMAQRLQLATGAAQLGIWDLDVTTGAMLWDERMLELYGATPTSFREASAIWRSALHPDDRERVLAQAEVNVREGKSWDGEFRIIRPAGTERTVRSTGIVVRDTAGKPVRVIGVNRDVSEERRLQAQLLQAQKMEAVGQLAGGVAHDFNNLLAVMTISLNLLQHHTATRPEAIREELAELLATVDLGAGLTRQLLSFSRRQVMTTARHDLNAVVEKSEKLLRRAIREDLELEIALAPGPLVIDADAGMVEQVLMNLCINAKDALPRGGRIDVATREVTLDEATAAAMRSGARAGRFAVLSVSDSGHGIEPHHLTRLFEPFFTTKEEGRGTGLGLSTVHSIMARHGGFVDVETAVRAGSTFRAYFPLVQGAVGAQLAHREDGAARATAAARILLVEDEVALRRMTLRCLERLGYEVVCAADGLDAVKAWDREGGHFDLLLTDMVMPKALSGLELGRKLRGRKPDLRILLVSGYSLELAREETLSLRGIAFLHKPYSLQTLSAAVKSCLEATT
jgi:two-component system cell cycle sensor histidine kinase/response regulator CckA